MMNQNTFLVTTTTVIALLAPSPALASPKSALLSQSVTDRRDRIFLIVFFIPISLIQILNNTPERNYFN